MPGARRSGTRQFFRVCFFHEDDMQLAVALIRRLQRTDDGQDLLEYGMLMSLIAIVAMGAISALGNAILSVFWSAIAAANV
jgi:Flp pilus assembly pilin Flp